MPAALVILVMVAALVAATIVDDVDLPEPGSRRTVTALSTASRTARAASERWPGGTDEGGRA